MARSRARDADVAAATATIVIRPFQQFESAVTPRRVSAKRSATYEISVRNTANSPLQASLRGEDAEGQVRFAFAPAQLAVPPGSEARAAATASAKRPWGREPRERMLTISLESNGNKASESVVFVQKPRRKGRTILVALAAAFVGLILVSACAAVLAGGDEPVDEAVTETAREETARDETEPVDEGPVFADEVTSLVEDLVPFQEAVRSAVLALEEDGSGWPEMVDAANELRGAIASAEERGATLEPADEVEEGAANALTSALGAHAEYAEFLAGLIPDDFQTWQAHEALVQARKARRAYARLEAAVAGLQPMPVHAKDHRHLGEVTDSFVIVHDELTVTHIGTYSVWTGEDEPNTFEAAVAAFGDPTASEYYETDPFGGSERPTCLVGWRTVGISIHFLDANPSCVPDDTSVFDFASATDPRWRLATGVGIGSSVDELRQVYPDATFDESTQTWWLITNQYEEPFPALEVEEDAGRVSSIIATSR